MKWHNNLGTPGAAGLLGKLLLWSHSHIHQYRSCHTTLHNICPTGSTILVKIRLFWYGRCIGRYHIRPSCIVLHSRRQPPYYPKQQKSLQEAAEVTAGGVENESRSQVRLAFVHFFQSRSIDDLYSKGRTLDEVHRQWRPTTLQRIRSLFWSCRLLICEVTHVVRSKAKQKYVKELVREGQVGTMGKQR